MLSTEHTRATDSHAERAVHARGALALGLVGALGEELLALLVSGADYSHVHVAVHSSTGLIASRFRPWKPGEGIVLADDAYLAATGDETFVPAGSPIARYGPTQLLEAARIARGCGVTRLTVIAPLAALLPTATAAAPDPGIELALRQVGFERLLIVWPTAADAVGPTGLRGMVHSFGSHLPAILRPGSSRAPTAKILAMAIAAAARAAPPGVTRLGRQALLQSIDPRPPGRILRNRAPG